MKYFSAFIKPASSLCMMRCKYCFYEDVSSARSSKSFGIMEDKTARRLIDRVFDFCEERTHITFIFQGGEPTLAGKDFFRNFTSYVSKNNKKIFMINYSIQTNALGLDEEWCEIFKENNFLVGVSLDGAKEINDINRIDAAGAGTFSRVMSSIELLKKSGVEFNILSVITRAMARHPKAVFDFFKKNGFKYLQLIPCLDPLGGEKSPHSLTAEDYAKFMKSFFDLWYAELMRGNYISVRIFDNLISMINGRPAEQCGAMGRCSLQFVVEGDGGVYPCDFYVLDKYRMGSILENTVQEISENSAADLFFSDCERKNPLCEKCSFYGICGGGCKRYRPLYNQIPDYCPYMDFLSHSAQRLMQAAGMFGGR